MTHRVNFTIEDGVWQLLLQVPKGERSKLVNDAIVQAMEKSKRLAAAKRSDAWRKRLPLVSNEKVLSMLREDRKR